MTLLSTLRTWLEDWQHRGQTLPEQYRGILKEKCTTCGRATTSFDHCGPLCFDCAVVKAVRECLDGEGV